MGLVLSSAATAITFMHCLPKIDAHIPYGPYRDVPNCLSSSCPNIREKELHPRLKNALQDFSSYNASFYERYFKDIKNDPEFLRLRYNGLPKKVLIASASFDQNGALDPQNLSPLVHSYNQDSDIKYFIAGSIKQICQQIKEAADLGTLPVVIIQGHGDSQGICLSNPENKSGWIDHTVDLSKCFQGLDPSGKIIILTSFAGAPIEEEPLNNIAQKTDSFSAEKPLSAIAQIIASSAQREVIAPTEDFYPRRLSLARKDGLHVFHPSQNNRYQNIFKVFRPIYSKCQQIFENALRSTEKTAVNGIKNYLVRKTLLSPTAGFEETKEYLRFCEDDPKKKLLVLSLAQNWDEEPDSSFDEELYGALAEDFDLMYKSVSSSKEICDAIKNVSSIKNFKHIILDFNKNQNTCGAQECIDRPEWAVLSHNHDWSNCFNGADPKEIIQINKKIQLTNNKLPPEMIERLISRLKE